MRRAWIQGGTVTNIILADAEIAALFVGLGLCDYCLSLPDNSQVQIGWAYDVKTDSYSEGEQ